MQGARFSIVITCHNQREFISDAIESVLSQRHTSKEVIVVDDGSRDGSLTVIQHYLASVKLMSLSTSVGAVEARNLGAAASNGEYLIFLDGDDLLAPWALDVHEEVIAERHPTTIVSGARWFEGLVPTLRPVDQPHRIEFVEYASLIEKDRRSGWYTGGFVVSRTAFHAAADWSPGIFHLDLMDLATKLRSSGKSILICSPYTLLYRMHGRNTIRDISPFLLAAHKILEKERAGLYPDGSGRLERFAWHAGMIVCWAKRGVQVGLHRDALRLIANGWLMVLAGIIRRSICRLRGRSPVQTVAFSLSAPSVPIECAMPEI